MSDCKEMPGGLGTGTPDMGVAMKGVKKNKTLANTYS